MNLREIDIELGMLGQEIGRLGNHLKIKSAENRDGWRRFLKAIENAEFRLSLAVEGMQVLLKKKSSRTPATLTGLYHWLYQYLLVIKNNYSQKAERQSRIMWIRLLQARLKNTTSSIGTGVSSEDLMELVLRQRKLTKSEEFLLHDLKILMDERDELFRRYRDLMIASTNWHAGHCLHTRLGVNLKDARQGPVLQGISQLLRAVGLTVSFPELKKNLKDKAGHMDETSQSFADAVTQNFLRKNPGKTSRVDRLDAGEDLEKKMRDLQWEEKNCDVLLQEALKKNPRTMRPVITRDPIKTAPGRS